MRRRPGLSLPRVAGGAAAAALPRSCDRLPRLAMHWSLPLALDAVANILFNLCLPQSLVPPQWTATDLTVVQVIRLPRISWRDWPEPGSDFRGPPCKA